MNDFYEGKKDGKKSQGLFLWSLSSFGNLIGLAVVYFLFMPSKHQFPDKSEAYYDGFISGIKYKRLLSWLFGLVFWYIVVFVGLLLYIGYWRTTISN